MTGYIDRNIRQIGLRQKRALNALPHVETFFMTQGFHFFKRLAGKYKRVLTVISQQIVCGGGEIRRGVKIVDHFHNVC